MRDLQYQVDAQAVLDAIAGHVFELLNGWAVVLPVLVGVGILLTVIRRSRTII